MRNQPLPALGKEDLVSELHRLEHLPALDEIGVGLEDRVDLLVGWNLVLLENPSRRLSDDSTAQLAVSSDLRANGVDGRSCHRIENTDARGSSDDLARFGDHSFGDRDQPTVCAHLATMSLGGSDALDLLHTAPGGAGATGEQTDPCRQERVQLVNESSHHPHGIPEQGVISRIWMSVSTQVVSTRNFWPSSRPRSTAASIIS